MRASKAPRQGNYRKDDESKGIGAGYRRERVKSVRARRLAVDAGDPVTDGREGCTYKSLNRCFLRIRNSKKEKLFLTPSNHPPVARGGLAAEFRVENAWCTRYGLLAVNCYVFHNVCKTLHVIKIEEELWNSQNLFDNFEKEEIILNSATASISESARLF